jgi:hypothetical protein
MKKTYLLLCLLFVFGISVKTFAQDAPPVENLIHQYTFDDGTANDSKGTLNGTLEDGAVITNKALNTSNGGYVSLSGADLGINLLSELTVEVWFTSVKGANTSFHMLYYFGDSNANGDGINYTCLTPARGNNVSRAMISTGEGSKGNENGVDGPEYDDGLLHHMVTVITSTNISFYIDGTIIGAQDLTGTNSLGLIGSTLAYFGKGGYVHDPIWKGSMHKISIYNSALTDANVTYLYNLGAEGEPTVSSSVSSLAFDNNYQAETITFNSANLSSAIAIAAPAGITVYNAAGNPVTSLNQNVVNDQITIGYDGTTPVDGVITFTSGTETTSIIVKSASDVACFVPLYTNNTNLIPENGGLSSMTSFINAWGKAKIITINTDPANVYCGAASVQVGDGTNDGTFDFHPGVEGDGNGGLLKANTTYRVKVMAKTMNGPFQLGIERTDMDNPSNNTILKSFDTGGEWKAVDFYFVTGSRIDVDPVIYLNDYNRAGKLAYFDNWELYATTDPVIFTSATELAFDPQYTTESFNVTAANLAGDITFTAPAGITVDPSTLPADAATSPVTITYDGTTAVNGVITLTSGLNTVNIAVKSAGDNSNCFTPLYTDRQNLIPDPFFNDRNNFNGWSNGLGTMGLINVTTNPDSVYCGSHSAKLYLSADIEVRLGGGVLTANSGYVARAMVRTFGGYFHMGINGEDTAIPGDKVDSINTEGAWQQMTFRFNTGETMSDVPVIFFNNDHNSGKLAYMDNWELYQMDELNAAVIPVKDLFEKLYVQDGRIVADFELDQSATVQLTVYTVTGSIVANEKIAGSAGLNHQVVDALLPSGVYMVKIMKNGTSSFRKLIK